jgi:hypothetical protein
MLGLTVANFIMFESMGIGIRKPPAIKFVDFYTPITSQSSLTAAALFMKAARSSSLS